jgi:Tol biopolymer transport system component
LKKSHIALLILLAVAAAITVGCGSSSNSYSMLPFVSDRTVDPATHLFIMKLNGTNITPVADNINTDFPYSPSISANHKKVVFGQFPNLWVANSDGTGQTQLTTFTDSSADNDSFVYEGKISPDGKKIVYGVARQDGETYDLRIMNVDGTGDTDLTPTLPDGMQGCYTGTFSADNSRIVFACYGSNSYALFLINPDGTNQTPVYSQTDYLNTPMFSPDGKNVLFVSFANEGAARHHYLTTARHGAHHYGSSSFTDQGIVSVGLDGSNPTVLVPNVFEAEMLNSTLYFTVEDANLNLEQIHKANADGTGAVSLSDGTADDWLGLTGGD